MGTAAAESLVVPEEEMRAEGALLVESEAETKVGSAGPGSGEMTSHAIRSDEARARRNAKRNQRQRRRKASISGGQNEIEIDGTQEAEVTEGAGKWGNSTEHSHGL